MVGANDLEGEVFERPPPRALGLVSVVTFAVAAGLVLFSPFVFRSLRDVTKQLPWVDPELFSALLPIALPGGAALLFFAGTFWAGRRYGRAVITRDHVVITPIAPTFRKIVVSRDDVRSLRETPHGLLIDAGKARSRALALLLPALVPARDADLARAYSLLDPGRRTTRTEASASAVLSSLGVGASSAPVFMLVGVVAWSRVTDGVDSAFQVLATLAGVAVGGLVAIPGRRRVHLGEETVSVGHVCGPWEDVRAFAAWGGWIAVTIGGLRAAAHVGRAAVVGLIPLARAKVAVDEVAPAWVRRRRVGLASAFALVLAVYTVVGPVAAFTHESWVSVSDHHGYRVAIVYRTFDAAPRLVVLADPPADGLAVRGPGSSSAFGWRGDDVVVDRQSGLARRRGTDEFVFPTDATVLRVRVDGVDVSTRPLSTPRGWPTGTSGPGPLDRGLDLLEDWFPDTTDPLLRDLLDGRTTTRCFAETTSDGCWLLTRVFDGAVTAVGVLSPEQGVGLGLDCVTCELLRRRPGSAAAAAVRWLNPRPTLEQVLAAQRLVRRGASVAEATAGFPPQGAR